MTEARTYAWIFCGISLIAKYEAVGIPEVEPVLDALNHALPTEREVSVSIEWLVSNDLIARDETGVVLSENGRLLASEIDHVTSNMQDVMDEVTSQFERKGANDVLDLDCKTMEPKPKNDEDL